MNQLSGPGRALGPLPSGSPFCTPMSPSPLAAANPSAVPARGSGDGLVLLCPGGTMCSSWHWAVTGYLGSADPCHK